MNYMKHNEKPAAMSAFRIVITLASKTVRKISEHPKRFSVFCSDKYWWDANCLSKRVFERIVQREQNQRQETSLLA